MLSGETKLGGRTFQVVNYDVITALNEHYIMKLMRASGLDGLMPGIEEQDEHFLIRLHAALVDTLQLPALLAGYLLPQGKTEIDWTMELARETQTFIERLTGPDDKAEIHRMGLMICLDFLRAGTASLKHSLNVLEALQTGPANQTQTAGH